MARCKNCPALEADPAGVGVIEYYSCGDGCPDEDFDFYGGDCMSGASWNEPDDDPEDLYYFEELENEYEKDIREAEERVHIMGDNVHRGQG